jgi:UDP-glucose 4-epimerase
VKRTLITGGSGFIGQYLVTALLQQGHRVRILDVRPPARVLSGAHFLKASILDRAKVREAIKDIDEVYHLAALRGMLTRQKDDFHAINCLGTEECFADNLTHRPPSATLEGVCIALWSKPVSIEKSRQELGYAPGPIKHALG